VEDLYDEALQSKSVTIFWHATYTFYCMVYRPQTLLNKYLNISANLLNVSALWSSGNSS
jgi:hypothetical protein